MFLVKQQDPLENLPQVFQNALMLGYKQGIDQERFRQQQQSILGRVLLQDQLMRRRQREADERRSLSKRIDLGWRDVTDNVTQSMLQYSPNLVEGEYGRTWLTPTPQLTPEQQERYDVIPTGKPGGFEVEKKPEPAYKVGERKEFKRDGKIVIMEYVGKGQGEAGGAWKQVFEAERWEGQGGGAGGKVPDPVVKAQSLVKSFAEKVDPAIAALIAASPKMANNPIVKSALQSKLPQDKRDIIERAWKVIDDYYTGLVPELPQTGTKSTGRTQFIFERGKGLIPANP